MVMALSSSVLISSHVSSWTKPDLVRIHEARVAHHVAAVGQVDREHRAAAVLDGRRAVVVQLLVVVRAHVGARERFFEVLEEGRVHRHDVFEVAVQRAILDHQDLAVALDDLGFDFADLFGEQDRVVALAVEDFLAGFTHADRTERIGLARPAERRLHFLPRLLQWPIRPLRDKARVRLDAVQCVEDDPRALGGHREALFDVLDRLMHVSSTLRTRPRTDQGLAGSALRIAPEVTRDSELS
jgi:hypothetical protein